MLKYIYNKWEEAKKALSKKEEAYLNILALIGLTMAGLKVFNIDIYILNTSLAILFGSVLIAWFVHIAKKHKK